MLKGGDYMQGPFFGYLAVGIMVGLMGRWAHEWVIGHALSEAGMRPWFTRLFRTDLSDLVCYNDLCEREGKVPPVVARLYRHLPTLLWDSGCWESSFGCVLPHWHKAA